LNKNSFRCNLEKLYYNLYFLLKNKKIEVYDKEIYLNGHTPAKFCKTLLSKTPDLSREEFIKAVHILRQNVIEFNKNNNDTVDLYLRALYIDGIRSKYYHYTNLCDNIAIHCISNGLFSLLKNQRICKPMPSAILPDSAYPVTVITTEVEKTVILNKKLTLPKTELD
jgi:hypothetical protein